MKSIDYYAANLEFKHEVQLWWFDDGMSASCQDFVGKEARAAHVGGQKDKLATTC